MENNNVVDFVPKTEPVIEVVPTAVGNVNSAIVETFLSTLTHTQRELFAIAVSELGPKQCETLELAVLKMLQGLTVAGTHSNGALIVSIGFLLLHAKQLLDGIGEDVDSVLGDQTE